jgi:hypothetical protein
MHADFSVELGRDDAALELPWTSSEPAVRFYDLKNHPELLQQIPEAVAYPELGAFLARIIAAGFPLATAKCDAWRSREVAPEEEIYGDRKFVSYVDLVFEDETQRCSFEKHEAFAKDLCRLLSQTPEIPAAVEVVIRRCYYHGENERPSGVANWEGVDRFAASERTEKQADSGHGMERRADAGERSEADIEETGAAERLDETVADERIRLSDPDESASGFCFTAYVTGFGDSDHEPRLRWQIALALLQNALVQLAETKAQNSDGSL